MLSWAATGARRGQRGTRASADDEDGGDERRGRIWRDERSRRMDLRGGIEGRAPRYQRRVKVTAVTTRPARRAVRADNGGLRVRPSSAPPVRHLWLRARIRAALERAAADRRRAGPAAPSARCWAIAALASLIAYPVWGLIADTLLGRDRTLVLTGASRRSRPAWASWSARTQPWLLAAFIVIALVCVGTLGARVRRAGPGRAGQPRPGLRPDAQRHLRGMGRGGRRVAGLIYATWGPQPVRALFVVTALALAAVVGARRDARAPMCADPTDPPGSA